MFSGVEAIICFSIIKSSFGVVDVTRGELHQVILYHKSIHNHAKMYNVCKTYNYQHTCTVRFVVESITKGSSTLEHGDLNMLRKQNMKNGAIMLTL